MTGPAAHSTASYAARQCGAGSPAGEPAFKPASLDARQNGARVLRAATVRERVLPDRNRDRIQMDSLLRRSLDRHLPSKQEKVAPAKSTPERQTEPQKRFFDAVSDAYASEIDRSTVWTAFREHVFTGTSQASYCRASSPARQGGDPPKRAPLEPLRVGFRRSVRGFAASERPRGGVHVGLAAAVPGGSAGFPGRFDLFGGPQVGLGKLHVHLRSGHLTFVPLR